MEEKLEPEELYHYTNIESLVLILKNHTIRYSPLNRMDDLTEAQSADVNNIGQTKYVSSWTDDKEESIPMWNMYSSLTSGVRIKLQTNPFQTYEIYPSDLEKVLGQHVEDESNGKPIISLIPIPEMIIKRIWCIEALNCHILNQVQYTDDMEKIFPHTKTINDDRLTLDTNCIGKYKRCNWSFQHEWRYMMTIIPFSLYDAVNNMYFQFCKNMTKMSEGKDIQAVPYYDLRISDTAFASMEITMSPRLSEANQTILQCVVEKYNCYASHEMTIRRSD